MARPKKVEVVGEEFEDIDNMPRAMTVGEVILGVFVGTRPGKFGDIFMLDSEKGERYNIYGGQQCESVLTPDKIGRTFRIRYLGKEKTSRGYEVHTYKFQIKKEKSA